MRTMPFGKYKGHDLSSLPLDYLRWLSSLADLRQPLKRLISEEYERRCRGDHKQRQHYQRLPIVPEELRPICQDIVDRGYRLLSKQTHPDSGGSHDSMVLVNKAIEFLRSKLL